MDGPLNVSDAQWFKQAQLDRGFSVGEYALGRLTGRPVITFSYPIFELDSDTIKYFVGTSLDLARISAPITTVQLPESTTFAAIDRQGVILYRYPEDDGWIGQSVATPELVQEIVSKGTGAIEATGSDNVERLYGFSPLDARSEVPSTYVIIGISKDVAFPGRHTLTRGKSDRPGRRRPANAAGGVVRHRECGHAPRIRVGGRGGSPARRQSLRPRRYGAVVGVERVWTTGVCVQRHGESAGRRPRRSGRAGGAAHGGAEQAQHRTVGTAATGRVLRDVATTLNGTLELREVLDRILENVGRAVPTTLPISCLSRTTRRK